MSNAPVVKEECCPGAREVRGGGGCVRGPLRGGNFAYQIGDTICAQFGAFPALCVSPVAPVARCCCPVVGSQSVCQGRSSSFIGREKVVGENVCELGLSGKKAAFFFLTLVPCGCGCVCLWHTPPSCRVSDGPAPKLEVRRNAPCRRSPQAKSPHPPPVLEWPYTVGGGG